MDEEGREQKPSFITNLMEIFKHTIAVLMIKVVAIGPESTGKSFVCEQLASHYNTLWCPEYARDYLRQHGREYEFDDLLEIAKGQIALEESYQSKIQGSHSFLFIDTDMYVMKVWCEFVFGKCHPFILEQVVSRQYDLYLLCNIDLEWQADEFREYPDLASRQKLYKIYKDILVNQSTPWIEISGQPNKRLETAITAIDRLTEK